MYARGLRISVGAFCLCIFASPGWSQVPQELEPQSGYRIILAGGQLGEFEIDPEGRIKHSKSGFVYPVVLGDMPARKIITYGPSDISVDFTNLGGGNGDVWISIFVYPRVNDLGGEIRKIESEIPIRLKSAHPAADLGALPKNAADGVQRWFRGNYGSLDVLSGYILVQRGEYWVQARTTIPTTATDGEKRAMHSLAEFNWFVSEPAKNRS